jgi:hypothetical protein
VAFDRSGLLRRGYFIKIGRKSNIIISDIDRSSSALKTEKWIHIIAIHSPPSTVILHVIFISVLFQVYP